MARVASLISVLLYLYPVIINLLLFYYTKAIYNIFFTVNINIKLYFNLLEDKFKQQLSSFEISGLQLIFIFKKVSSNKRAKVYMFYE